MLSASLAGFHQMAARRSAPGSRSANDFFGGVSRRLQAAIDYGVFSRHGGGRRWRNGWLAVAFVTERKHRRRNRQQQSDNWAGNRREVTALPQSRRALIAKMARTKTKPRRKPVAAFRTKIALIKRTTHSLKLFTFEPVGWRGGV